MEEFVNNLVKNSDLSVLTKRMVRDAYKNHIGRDHLSLDKKREINEYVDQLLDKITIKFQLSDTTNDGNDKTQELPVTEPQTPSTAKPDLSSTKINKEIKNEEGSPKETQRRRSNSPRLRIEEVMDAVMKSDDDDDDDGDDDDDEDEDESEDDVSDEENTEAEDEKGRNKHLESENSKSRKRKFSLDSDSESEYEPFKDEIDSVISSKSKSIPDARKRKGNTSAKKDISRASSNGSKCVGSQNKKSLSRKRRRIMIESDGSSSSSSSSDDDTSSAEIKNSDTDLEQQSDEENKIIDFSNKKSTVRKRTILSDSDNLSSDDMSAEDKNIHSKTIEGIDKHQSKTSPKNILKANKKISNRKKLLSESSNDEESHDEKSNAEESDDGKSDAGSSHDEKSNAEESHDDSDFLSDSSLLSKSNNGSSKENHTVIGKNKKRKLSATTERMNDSSTSEDEDLPLSSFNRKSMSSSSPSQKLTSKKSPQSVVSKSKIIHVSSEEKRKIKKKTSTKENSKPLDSSGVSSDSDLDDVPLKKSVSKKNGDKKQSNTTKSKVTTVDKNKENSYLVNLRKICHAAGIIVKNTTHLAGCETDDQKVKRLKEILQKAGMKGRPSMKKVADVKLKRELADLDTNNILQTHGLRKRRTNDIFARHTPSPVKHRTPPRKMFSRLKDIIDSENSDA